MPKCAAMAAPSPLEPSIQSSGMVGPSGMARMPRNGCPWGNSPRKKPRRSLTCDGKCSMPRAPGPWASARAVRGSLPGARPMPRSMRPGWSVSSIRKFSATFSAL